MGVMESVETSSFSMKLKNKLVCWFAASESADSPQDGAKIPCQFKVGDKVRVDLEADILKAMQDGHGGWNPRMAEVRSRSS